MPFCSWCGEKKTVGKHGYCAACEEDIRGTIQHGRDSLLALSRRAHKGLSPSEQAGIRAKADADYSALLGYKERGVPFFKSDPSEWRREIDARMAVERQFEPIELSGLQHKTVIVERATVRVIRAGSLLASAREKSIPIRSIAGVEVKKPGSIVNGFIQFQTAGQRVGSSSFKYTGGAFDAVVDENSMMFAGIESYEIALQMKEYVESYAEQAAAPVVVQQAAAPVSVADELIKLKGLLDAGILTQAEFDAQKAKLMR